MVSLTVWAVQVIAAAGVASKRASEAIVQNGVVKVNGKVVTLPQHPVIASVDEASPDVVTISFHSSLHWQSIQNKLKGLARNHLQGRTSPPD